MWRVRIHVDGVCRGGGGRANAADPNSCGRRAQKRRWTRKSGVLKFMWTVLCGSGGGRANATGPHSCGRCLQKRRWTRKCGGSKNSCGRRLQKRRWARKCGGPKFMWSAFGEAAVGAQMRQVQIQVGGVFAEAAVGAQMWQVQIHVDGVCRGGGGRANARH